MWWHAGNSHPCFPVMGFVGFSRDWNCDLENLRKKWVLGWTLSWTVSCVHQPPLQLKWQRPCVRIACWSWLTFLGPSSSTEHPLLLFFFVLAVLKCLVNLVPVVVPERNVCRPVFSACFRRCENSCGTVWPTALGSMFCRTWMRSRVDGAGWGQVCICWFSVFFCLKRRKNCQAWSFFNQVWVRLFQIFLRLWFWGCSEATSGWFGCGDASFWKSFRLEPRHVWPYLDLYKKTKNCWAWFPSALKPMGNPLKREGTPLLPERIEALIVKCTEEIRLKWLDGNSLLSGWWNYQD